MQENVVGVFESYRSAAAAVRDLELVGIVGEQVELISDADEDVRTIRPKDDPAAEVVRDVPGQMPDYIGEQEFYATHVRQGRAVLVVRPSNHEAAEQASTIIRDHGAEILGSHRPGEQPGSEASRSKAATASGADSNTAPAGGDSRDLDARGQEFREPKQ
jgi:hypothetical protein